MKAIFVRLGVSALQGDVMKLILPGIITLLALLTTGQTLAANGETIYDKSCAVCHNVLEPKLGDKAAWEPKLTQGIDGLVASVLKGKGVMPAKGGDAKLSEADIKAAVLYMMAKVK
tara:strand:- start:2314 stop:2661 length:348 start_codon:yes stop_codon:yes gene_type:complete